MSVPMLAAGAGSFEHEQFERSQVTSTHWI